MTSLVAVHLNHDYTFAKSARNTSKWPRPVAGRPGWRQAVRDGHRGSAHASPRTDEAAGSREDRYSPVHSLAVVFPMMDSDGLSALAEGIIEGIIDGGNRLAACKLAELNLGSSSSPARRARIDDIWPRPRNYSRFRLTCRHVVRTAVSGSEPTARPMQPKPERLPRRVSAQPLSGCTCNR